ncbi:MAG: thiamine pyrophosphate-dependent enzyme [Candidatus Methylomirabilales bacterium]
MSVAAGSPGLEKTVGNYALIETLAQWGVTHNSGVNGGGVIHVTKYLEPLTHPSQITDGIPRFLTMGEYASGFMPLGYYLASGRIACSITTTGAATKLGSSGITDAKVHNIPALFIMALNSIMSIGNAPLQDVSEHGMNIVPQLQAELGDGCIVIDNINRLERDLAKAQSLLHDCRPVAIGFHPDILSKAIEVHVPWRDKPRTLNKKDVEAFLKDFPTMSKNRRVVIYVGEEAAFYPNIQELTTELSDLLQAPTIWSVNGANAVSEKNPYSYGYVLFGGNDKAMELWRSLNAEDIVITLGFCPGEYSINLESIPAQCTWHFGEYMHGYGHVNGEFGHRCKGDYRQIRGDIGLALEAVIPRLKAMGISKDRPKVEKLDNLNFREVWRDVRKDCVDFMSFYEELPKHWQPHSIGFDDVCVSYKDRQYVTQRPHPNIKFWAMHHGSAMGGSFGMGVGAKLADPSLHTFIFSGDGCWRLFGGCLADAANLDLRLFIINNGTYGIVDKGLEIIIPTVEKPRYHSKLPSIDFVAAAKAHGWDGFYLKPDLSNLKEIMDACYSQSGKSILVDVPVDTEQVVGLNARLLNLTTQAYL